MIHLIRIRQRIGVDLDAEHGDEAGQGASLVDLAVLTREIVLPFAPFPGLVLDLDACLIRLEEIQWSERPPCFLCIAEPVWRQSRQAAEEVLADLVRAGFSAPNDPKPSGIH